MFIVLQLVDMCINYTTGIRAQDLNICIGKTAALKQREEASLLLSKIHPCGKELGVKTNKVSLY